MTNIVTLKKATKEHLVGQKALHLAVLAQKFPIPAAFIITAAAFEQFLEKNQITKQAKEIIGQTEEDEIKIQEASDAVRMLIFNAQFPEELREEIHDAYYALNIDETNSLNDLMETGEEPIVVIRSSQLNDEQDVYESVLGIQGLQKLEEGILSVWASFYNSEAIKKMRQAEQKPFAIIIQKMIDSQSSGVIHTSYKMNKEEVLILGCKGLGVVLKSGLSNPDKYFITKKSLNIASIEVGKQPFMLERDFDTNKITKVYMQEDYSKKQKITDRHIGELTLIGNTIEQIFGKPQEVDFAIYKETISVLGSRTVAWYEENLQPAPQKIVQQGPTEEEIEQKEKEISIGITQELEQDTLVAKALRNEQVVVPQETAPVISQPPADPNDINAVILGIDFATALSEVTQTPQVEITAAVITRQTPQSASIIFEKQITEAITETVAETVAEKESANEERVEQAQAVSEKSLSTFEKTAGNLIIQCFKQVKEKIPKEQWASSPELRHLAVLAQNFSQKNVPPTIAQVKFAMDAIEKVRAR